MADKCCETLEAKLNEAQHQIDEQAQALKDMQRRIDAAISKAQQIIAADAKTRSRAGVPRGEWSYSKGSDEASLSIITKLGSGGSDSVATIRRRAGLPGLGSILKGFGL